VRSSLVACVRVCVRLLCFRGASCKIDSLSGKVTFMSYKIIYILGYSLFTCLLHICGIAVEHYFFLQGIKHLVHKHKTIQ
jgi:hypothetical protein